MNKLKFFVDDLEEKLDLPKKDFMDELKVAKLRYKYSESEYDDTYDRMLTVGQTTKMLNGKNDVIFLNPKAITEENIAHTLVHETLHIVIWRLERIAYSENAVRILLKEN